MLYEISESCEKEIAATTRRDSKSFRRIMDTIESLRNRGFVKMRNAGKIEKIRGKIHELRVTLPNGIGRILFYVDDRGTARFVRFFVKKTNKTPDNEIAVALSRIPSS